MDIERSERHIYMGANEVQASKIAESSHQETLSVLELKKKFQQFDPTKSWKVLEIAHEHSVRSLEL